MKSKKRAPDGEKPGYVASAKEQAVLKKQLERLATATAPRMKVVKGKDAQQITVDHQHEQVGFGLLAEALGTADRDFVRGILGQLANVGTQGSEIDASELNFMLSIVKGIKPRDQLETLLAAQMAAIHMATMTFARRLAHVANIPQQDSAERALNKLARTYTTQMEALKRYRTGGEQKVTVQHVSVNEGGQAIVGNVNQAGPTATAGKAAAPPPALSKSQEPPMALVGEGEREAIPAGSPGKASLRGNLKK